MAERRLVILKHSGKTPIMGMCERCQLKFFTPRELTHQPKEAEENLGENSMVTYASTKDEPLYD